MLLGVGQIDATLPVAQIVDRLEAEYRAARARLARWRADGLTG